MNFLIVTLPLYLIILSTLFSPQPFSSLHIDTQLEYIYKEYGLMLEGHCHTILSIIIHNSIVLTGSKDYTIRGWDIKTGKQLYILYGHKSGVNQLLIHSDLDLLISGSWDGSVIFWELETQRKVKELKPHTEWVTELKLQLPSTLWTVGNDGLLNIIDLNSLTILKTVKIASSFVWSFDISPDFNFAVAATNDKNLTIWDLKTFEPFLSFKAHKTQINFIGFVLDGQMILSNGRDDGMILWNSRTGEEVEKIDKISRAKFIRKIEEGKILVVTRENDVLIWNLLTKSSETRLKIQNEGDVVLKFFADQKKLWFARDYYISTLDLKSGSEEKVTESLSVLNEVLLNHQEKVILGKTEDGKITIWDLPTGHVLEKVSSEEQAAKLEKTYPGVSNLFTSPIK